TDDRRTYQQWTTIDQLHRRECTCNTRGVLFGPGNRCWRRRRFVWRLQSSRQTYDQLSAIGRTVAALLQPEADGTARLSFREQGAAVSVRVWSQLHDVRILQFEA